MDLEEPLTGVLIVKKPYMSKSKHLNLVKHKKSPQIPSGL